MSYSIELIWINSEYLIVIVSAVNFNNLVKS